MRHSLTALWCRAIAVAGLTASLGAAAQAADDAPFYKNKTITIIVSTGEGGTYSLNARLVSRYMPHHLPGNPQMIVQNMPGGGHMLATNYIYNVAPKDGTVIGTVDQNVPAHQILSGVGVRYDAAKINWLGGFGADNTVLAVWHTAGINTYADLASHDVTIGATGDGSSAYTYPLLMIRVLGLKNLKIVKGYRSTPEVELAMERGEVQARAGSYTSFSVDHADWVTQKLITFPLQIGEKRQANLADIPLWTEVATTDEQKEILELAGSPVGLGRPFLAPPGVPADRIALLRKALAETLVDPDLLAEAAAQKVSIIPMSADEVTHIIKETMEAPADIVAKTKTAMDPLAH
jgi:tripartite-type tricarboxylate transporter receptor subunit TctC